MVKAWALGLVAVVITSCAIQIDGTYTVATHDSQCVADRLACGGDGVQGDPNTLYQCSGGVLSPVKTCASGCKANPGADDACATSACTMNGLACTQAAECCDNVCASDGHCGCLANDQPCLGNGDCCDGTCASDGYCGCIQSGDACNIDSDCCQGYCCQIDDADPNCQSSGRCR